MKSIKKIIFSLILLFSSLFSTAQIDFGTFLEAGVADANTILEKYMEPAFLGFGYGINSGWYNTAKPHKLLGFDITPTITLANVPSKAQFFTFNENDYNNIRLHPDSPTNQAPTLFGPNLGADDVPLYIYTSNQGLPNENEVAISSPTGLGLDEVLPFNAVPSGMLQVGIGVFKNTDLKFRIVPKIEEDDFSFQMFGIGVMHDLKQWVPGFKQLPIDVSGFVGWNKMEASFFLDSDQPDNLATLKTNSFTLQGLISKKFSVLTLFAGAGIANTTTSFDLLGEYDTEAGVLRSSDGELPSLSFSSTGPRINAGFRLKLLILTIHMDYALQKYSTLTTGIGISIR